MIQILLLVLLVAVSPTCPSPKLIDRTGLGFTDTRSQEVLKRAIVVCKQRYKKCPGMVRRNTETDYSVVCGPYTGSSSFTESMPLGN